MRAWRLHRYGRPTEALRLDHIDVPVPGPGQLRVRTTATVLNFNEVDGCRGRYLTVNPPLPYTLGMELVGVVDAVGPGVDGGDTGGRSERGGGERGGTGERGGDGGAHGASWVGRRVVATATGAFGAHAEYVIAPLDMTFDAPGVLNDVQAAGFFFPFHLAHLGLFLRGRLTEGETVLIHAGAGGVGSAAVQLAARAGANVIATAGGPTKTARCRELGAQLAIDYRRDDFVEAVLEATGGRGVDVVFDGVGGAVGEESLRCLAHSGRYLIVGFASGIEAEERATVTPRTLCFGNFSVGGVLLSYSSDPLAARKATGFNITARAVGDEIHAALRGLLAEDAIRPVIGSVVSFAELPEALEEMEDRLTIGRTVVDLGRAVG